MLPREGLGGQGKERIGWEWVLWAKRLGGSWGGGGGGGGIDRGYDRSGGVW